MVEYDEAVINAKVFANEFRDLCKYFAPSVRETNKRLNVRKMKCNTKILDFLSGVRTCVSRGRCDGRAFKAEVLRMNAREPLDVEIWWYLLKCGLVSREDLRPVFESPNYRKVAEHISYCLFRNVFVLSEHSSIVLHNVNSDFIEYMLESKEDCKSSGESCLVYDNFLRLIAKVGTEGNESKRLNIHHLVGALKSSLDAPAVKSFLLDVLKSMLKGKSLPLEYLLYENEYYMQNAKCRNTCDFKELFAFLTSTEIVSQLKQELCISSQPIHWSNLFELLSGLSSHDNDVSKEIKNLIHHLLDEALKTLDKGLLLHIFMLARYCSFSKMPNFPTYVQWFGSTFSGESSRPINTKDKATFFIDFLCDFVKHDSAYCLKVHINRTPSLPAECQSLLSDYVRLAKTRLDDLNESFDLGLFEDVTAENYVEHDVKTVLNLFAVNNEIPKCVLEASLFCKAYYEKKFLAELVSKFEGNNSARHKLIMKLNNLGKIPNSLFAMYKNKF